ncbi:MAG: excinuclease ABC subunit UvrC [Candidatus Oxydemutatoraceae bacterium WSBS_2016_MAG_OTU14]
MEKETFLETVIKDFVKQCSSLPGVYIMRDQADKVLYVGKAKNLKKRVASYANRQRQSSKNRLMLDQVQTVESVITNNEAEALLLENNLIKEHSPRYNILLRDDKSYPYIRITTQDPFPRIAFYRGQRRSSGEYFGPYTNVTAVRETLNLLSRLFRLRQCQNTVFLNRTRPCLQYQIKRCTAPCVNYIKEEDYKEDIENARQFLSGQSEVLIQNLIKKMDQAAAVQHYEKAKEYRDQIRMLRQVTEQQYVSNEHGEVDIIACAQKGEVVCIHAINVRNGLNIGSRSYYPVVPKGDLAITESDVLGAFLGQYYLNRSVPREIIASVEPKDWSVLQTALRSKAKYKTKLQVQVRDVYKRKLLQTAQENAAYGLSMKIGSKEEISLALKELREAFKLDKAPQRMECFDISHTMGEATVASCVVFGPEGAMKDEYRRFNIENITPGDDYAALNQAVMRRYQRILKGEIPSPDILWIDGGKGQLHEALRVLNELGISDIVVVGIAKDSTRKSGLETFWHEQEGKLVRIELSTMTRHWIEKLRDEAHRFAITGHRRKRAQKRSGSVLEKIAGVGPKRRLQLIKHFGGLSGIQRAGIDELSKVPNISQQLAKVIYNGLHGVNK